jgi:hypothetical protein
VPIRVGVVICVCMSMHEYKTILINHNPTHLIKRGKSLNLNLLICIRFMLGSRVMSKNACYYVSY